MLRAVIVEDEMLVKLGMKTCVEQAKLDIVVSAALSSAEEALQFFAKNEAEVLITDIRLTGLSGLDLLEQIQEKLPRMLTVVLSCYEDFSYARRAYELGADTYILKHELEENALAGLIREMYDKKFGAHDIKHDSMMQESLHADTVALPQLVIENRNCYVGLLWLRAKSANDAAYENISFPVLCEAANETMGFYKCGWAYLHQNQTKVVLIFAFSQQEQNPQQVIEAVFAQLRSKIDTYFNMDCFLYLGGPVQGSDPIREMYEELKRTQGWLFYCTTPCVVQQYEVPHPPKRCTPLLLTEPFSFSEDWKTESEERIVQYFFTQQQMLCDPATLRIEIDRYMYAVRQTLKQDFGIAPEDIFEDGNTPSYMDIESITHAQALQEWVLQITYTVCDAVCSGRITHPLVAKIISYAHSHYAEKITLENVAEEFHINVTYFCRVFKKQTGQNFVTFLNGLRIDQAIVLLNTTDMTVEQIADAVGVKTANYFFRLFKKVTGKTVGHYRKG